MTEITPLASSQINHDQLKVELVEGYSLRRIADALEISPSTVLRIVNSA
jgi:DNA-binding CsgD family transcriptional regulator